MEPGLLGIVWFILWMALVSSSPYRSRRITEVERLMISKCLDSADTPVISLQLLSMCKLYYCIIGVIVCLDSADTVVISLQLLSMCTLYQCINRVIIYIVISLKVPDMVPEIF